MKKKLTVATREPDFQEDLRDEPTIGTCQHAVGAGGVEDIRACISPAKSGGADRRYLGETRNASPLPTVYDARICCNHRI
jgi:hypothetical protein